MPFFSAAFFGASSAVRSIAMVTFAGSAAVNTRWGTTYTNFEVFQKAGTSVVTLTGTTSDTSLGIDVQNGTLPQ